MECFCLFSFCILFLRVAFSIISVLHRSQLSVTNVTVLWPYSVNTVSKHLEVDQFSNNKNIHIVAHLTAVWWVSSEDLVYYVGWNRLICEGFTFTDETTVIKLSILHKDNLMDFIQLVPGVDKNKVQIPKHKQLSAKKAINIWHHDSRTRFWFVSEYFVVI